MFTLFRVASKQFEIRCKHLKCVFKRCWSIFLLIGLLLILWINEKWDFFTWRFIDVLWRKCIFMDNRNDFSFLWKNLEWIFTMDVAFILKERGKNVFLSVKIYKVSERLFSSSVDNRCYLVFLVKSLNGFSYFLAPTFWDDNNSESQCIKVP